MGCNRISVFVCKETFGDGKGVALSVGKCGAVGKLKGHLVAALYKVHNIYVLSVEGCCDAAYKFNLVGVG